MEGMQSLGDAVNSVMSKFLKPVGKCPQCEGQLMVWKNPNREGGLRCPPTCPNCGYAEKIAKSTTMSDLDATIAAKKAKAKNYLRLNSIVSNEKVFKCTFSNYQRNTEPEKRAFEFAHKATDKVVSGQTVHVTFMGATGTGKTHLAMAAAYLILKRTNYAAKVCFLDWRELLDTIKNGMHENSGDVQKYGDQLIKEFGKADVVILDDLGAERGTDFDKSLADKFWRLREDKTVITTTNLNTAELKQHYGDRTVSRMQMHGADTTFAMAGVQDHRKGIA